MESFHWDKSFITNLLEVDQQHRHLVHLINQLGGHLAGSDISIDYIETVFQELTSYADYHFKTEEEMMGKMNVDQRHIDFHTKEHLEFFQEVTFMHAAISPDSPNAVHHLLDFLIHWLAYHILGADQNMARQIKAIQSGSSPNDAYHTEERMSDNATEPLLYALNGLFHQVSARNRELVQLNQTLEAKVAERTKALSKINLRLEELSLTDTLTELPNRRYAMQSLEKLWDESSQSHKPLACMMIDADHFKEVNDTYGHDAGDHVLYELAQTLLHAMRNGDIVCRLGGDEFLVLCPDTGLTHVQALAEATRKTVSKLRVPTGDGTWHGSISIGLSVRTADMQGYEALMKSADNGVYEAKRAGKNCCKTQLKT